MKLNVSNVPNCWTISDVEKLDPINVYWHEIGPYSGRIIVECYGKAWSSFWGAMSRPLIDFVRGLDAGYLASCLMAGRKHTAKERQYLLQVSEAVILAVRRYATN